MAAFPVGWSTPRVIFDARDGLGNRMQGLASALLLAMTANARLEVRWPVHSSVVSPFATVFPRDASPLIAHVLAFDDSSPWELLTTAVPRVAHLLYNRVVIAQSADFASYYDPRFVCGALMPVPQRVLWLLSNQVRELLISFVLGFSARFEVPAA